MTNSMILGLAIVSGAGIGSLLNVVIYRLPRMITQQELGIFNLWLPRSHCPCCRTTLAWYDNIPLFSWIRLRGRCRYCAQRISWRYPCIELCCSLSYLLLALLLPAEVLPAAWLLVAFLLALSLIDITHLLLPDALTLSLLWLGLALQIGGYLPAISLQDSVIGAMSGWLSLWLIARSYHYLRGKEVLGMGDAKLLAALGVWLGWQALPQLLVLACVGTLLGLVLTYLLFRRPLYRPFPFGPGLASAGLLLFVQQNML